MVVPVFRPTFISRLAFRSLPHRAVSRIHLFRPALLARNRFAIQAARSSSTPHLPPNSELLRPLRALTMQNRIPAKDTRNANGDAPTSATERACFFEHGPLTVEPAAIVAAASARLRWTVSHGLLLIIDCFASMAALT